MRTFGERKRKFTNRNNIGSRERGSGANFFVIIQQEPSRGGVEHPYILTAGKIEFTAENQFVPAQFGGEKDISLIPTNYYLLFGAVDVKGKNMLVVSVQ